MDFQAAIRSGLSKWLTFSGRAARSEYWYWLLFVVILTCVLSFIGISASEDSVIGFIVSLFFWLATLSVSVRRLHDLDKTGWWVLLSLIPLIGTLILWAWFTIKGTTGSNQHGEDPLMMQTGE